MADDNKTADVQPAERGSATALHELMEGAKALQAIQQQAAQDAMRLPNPRLDDPQHGHHFLTADGRRVDSEGREVK